MDDFLIIGGGIFGMTTAIELKNRGYKVSLINPGSIPHPLAASTDITKLVRMEYGSDMEYFRMAEISIERWHEWNGLFGEELYHEIGLLMLTRKKIDSEHNPYELHCIENLSKAGYALNRLNAEIIKEQFPMVNSLEYTDGNFNPKAGYVESGRVIEKLKEHAQSLGVAIYEGQTAQSFVVVNSRLNAVKTDEGSTFKCGHAIAAAGAHTPYLLPELQPFMRSTGHSVFWLKPKDPKLFSPPHLPNFTADTSNTGWYGFPYSSPHNVVKLGRHTIGYPVHPIHDKRELPASEIEDMWDFVNQTFPILNNAELVYTRQCLYTDTLDGHFWIDHHPEIRGLSVSTGGSGHGFKMGPVLGEMTADMAEGKAHRFSKRYRWRDLKPSTKQVEESRFIKNRKVRN
ncbi:MAG: FAD-dependent oxidoreductase [Flavobacteriaceae bacterium]|nr:FAD-dependent oxidoreductase [Bacteroidia bacterium]NNF74414.1 FAD-dependent oxidoreductase [Flavobacteriaceae bacterium]